MVKKIISFSDLHLRTFKYHNEYKEVLTGFLNQIKELIKDYKYDEVRIAFIGDYVHNKITISSELLMLGTWLLKELEKIAPVIIVAGNHDMLLNNLDRMDSITPMVELINSSNIKYLKESKCYEDDNIVWCNYSIFEESKRPDIETFKLENGIDNKKFCGLYHGPIMGNKTDIGFEFDHGAEVDIFKGLDFCLLGDIHLHQTAICKDGEKLIKCVQNGSIIQQSYGENTFLHGFLLWDVENKDFEFHEVKNPYLFYQFKIKSLSDIDDDKEVLINK